MGTAQLCQRCFSFPVPVWISKALICCLRAHLHGFPICFCPYSILLAGFDQKVLKLSLQPLNRGDRG